MAKEMIPSPLLDLRFQEALRFAVELHAAQSRKGTSIPYIGHLLGVCSIVIDAGGSEDEVIASLLHDGPEDQGGLATLERIRRRFGDRVAEIVEHCSDTFEEHKPPWRDRKERYLETLRSCEDESVYLVSAADKLHNLRAILKDYREIGDLLWPRFSAPSGKVDVLWYYEALLQRYESGPFRPRSRWVLRDLRETLAAVIAHRPAM